MWVWMTSVAFHDLFDGISNIVLTLQLLLTTRHVRSRVTMPEIVEMTITLTQLVQESILYVMADVVQVTLHNVGYEYINLRNE